MNWKPIDTAPDGVSILLYCNDFIPIYCGRFRAGTLGEPQPGTVAWRCDSSGMFATPRFWMPLPQPPLH